MSKENDPQLETSIDQVQLKDERRLQALALKITELLFPALVAASKGEYNAVVILAAVYDLLTVVLIIEVLEAIPSELVMEKISIPLTLLWGRVLLIEAVRTIDDELKKSKSAEK